MPDRPRTFAEVIAAEDPAERGRMERTETFKDANVANEFHTEVSVHEDRHGNSDYISLKKEYCAWAVE
jgi:hypothetical protein